MINSNLINPLLPLSTRVYISNIYRAESKTNKPDFIVMVPRNNRGKQSLSLHRATLWQCIRAYFNIHCGEGLGQCARSVSNSAGVGNQCTSNVTGQYRFLIDQSVDMYCKGFIVINYKSYRNSLNDGSIGNGTEQVYLL